eukprot:scaffold4588_cov60-Cylindrotheca_fusiformis.AAC.1
MSPQKSASRLGKENVEHHSRNSISSSSSSNKSCNNFKTTPTKGRQVSLSSMKTPPGSSKVLRKHFASIQKEGSSSSQRRLMESGPVRILSPSSIDDGSVLSISLDQQQYQRCGEEESPPPTTSRRDCMDPVATTLWQEDACLQSWSSDLEDVYGSESQNITRPKPFRPPARTTTSNTLRFRS